MPYLIDADVVIQLLHGHAGTASFLARLAADEISISWVTAGEVYEGAFRSSNPEAHLDRFRALLSTYPALGLNDDVMTKFAETRSRLRRDGRAIADMDLLVAATALAYDLTLLTYNRRHFDRVPDLRIYPTR